MEFPIYILRNIFQLTPSRKTYAEFMMKSINQLIFIPSFSFVSVLLTTRGPMKIVGALESHSNVN